MLYNNIERLCKQNNITIGQLEKTLKFGNSTIQKWQYHSPSVDKVNKVARHFNVTIDSLIKE